MSKFDTGAWFVSLGEHIQQQALDGTVTGVCGYACRVHVGGLNRSSGLADYAAWARSMTGVQLVTVTSVASPEGYTQLQFVGGFTGADRVEVVVCLGEPEGDLLAANVPLRDVATFPVELLSRLVDAGAAEAVAR